MLNLLKSIANDIDAGLYDIDEKVRDNIETVCAGLPVGLLAFLVIELWIKTL